MHPTITTSVTIAAFALGAVSTLALAPPTASAQEVLTDPCGYSPSSAPAAVACTGAGCVVCADGTCRRFAPASCWTTVKP